MLSFFSWPRGGGGASLANPAYSYIAAIYMDLHDTRIADNVRAHRAIRPPRQDVVPVKASNHSYLRIRFRFLMHLRVVSVCHSIALRCSGFSEGKRRLKYE